MKDNSYCLILLVVLLLPTYITIVAEPFNLGNIKINETEENEIVAFSTNTLLSTNDNIYAHHVEVSMAISEDGILFVGWKNSGTHSGGGVRVSIVRSLDGGSSWSAPYDMPMYGGLFTSQSDPWLYWYNNTLYYAYLEFEPEYFNNPSGGYLTQMTVAKSLDNGVSWTLVKATNGSYFADKETIVVGKNNTVYLAYDDANIAPHGNATVRVTRSLDGGNTYQKLSVIGEDEFFIGPYITLNATGDPYVAWSWIPEGGGNIFFSKSTDKGVTFEKPKMLNQDGNYTAIESPAGKTSLPLLKFDPFNRLYVLWADKYDQIYNTFDVFLRYSDDYGETWSSRIRVNPSVQGNQWNPDMVIDSEGKLHIVYYHEINGVYRPYYRTLEFTGIDRDAPHFSDQIVIADSDTSSYFIRPGEYFAIQLDNESIPHVVWTDGRNNELDIFYAKGLTTLPFLTPELITIIIIIFITAFLSISIFIYYRHMKNIPETNKLLKKKIKN